MTWTYDSRSNWENYLHLPVYVFEIPRRIIKSDMTKSVKFWVLIDKILIDGLCKVINPIWLFEVLVRHVYKRTKRFYDFAKMGIPEVLIYYIKKTSSYQNQRSHNRKYLVLVLIRPQNCRFLRITPKSANTLFETKINHSKLKYGSL